MLTLLSLSRPLQIVKFIILVERLMWDFREEALQEGVLGEATPVVSTDDLAL